MSNETYLTVRGFVGADPMVFSNGNGNRTVIVRVGVTPRNRNRQTQQFEDGPTAWYSVRCFGDLADNVAQTIRTGAPVLARGRLTQRKWEGRDGVERMEMTIAADSLGLELSTVTATYAKSRRSATSQAEGQELSASGLQEGGHIRALTAGDDQQWQAREGYDSAAQKAGEASTADEDPKAGAGSLAEPSPLMMLAEVS